MVTTELVTVPLDQGHWIEGNFCVLLGSQLTTKSAELKDIAIGLCSDLSHGDRETTLFVSAGHVDGASGHEFSPLATATALGVVLGEFVEFRAGHLFDGVVLLEPSLAHSSMRNSMLLFRTEGAAVLEERYCTPTGLLVSDMETESSTRKPSTSSTFPHSEQAVSPAGVTITPA